MTDYEFEELEEDFRFLVAQLEDRDLMILELQREIEDLKDQLKLARDIREP